jgi:plastocyanin
MPSAPSPHALPPHQVSVVGKDGQRSDVMLKGQSATLKFDAQGNIVDYICGLHPGMKGKIEVVAKQ